MLSEMHKASLENVFSTANKSTMYMTFKSCNDILIMLYDIGGSDISDRTLTITKL